MLGKQLQHTTCRHACIVPTCPLVMNPDESYVSFLIAVNLTNNLKELFHRHYTSPSRENGGIILILYE